VRLLGFKISTIYRTIKGFESKNWFREKCAILSSLVHAALKKQTAGPSAKSYREFGWKIQVYHNTVEKYLTNMGVHRKGKKSAPKTTARQQTLIKARLKLQTQNFFSAKSMKSPILRLTAESANSKVIMSVKIIQQQKMSNYS
jgi:hypothetical protein